MTKIELLRQVIEKKNKSAKTLLKEMESVKSDRSDALSRMYMQYFGDCLVGDDTIEVSEHSVYFKRFDPDYNYHKELLTIYLRPESWRDDEASKIETSFYTTNASGDYELNRMVLIGKVGQVILDFKDDIIADYNSVKRSFEDKLSELNKEIWRLERETNECQSEIDSIEKNILLNKLEVEGLEFELDKENLHRLPNLDIRFDSSVRHIRKIKVLGKTKSGKSANIEVETVYNNWNPDTKENELVYNTRTYEKVRMNKISSLINYGKRLVVS